MNKINYNVKLISKTELSSRFQVVVQVLSDQNKSQGGKKVELKLVRPTNVGIKWIKSNKNPDSGWLNNVINPNINESSFWNSTYKTKIIHEYNDEIIYFTKYRDSLYVLDKSGTLYKDNQIICTNLDGFKIIIDDSGIIYCISNNKVTRILPHLSYYQHDIKIQNIKDITILNNQWIILSDNILYVFKKEKQIKEINLSFNPDCICAYQNNLLLIKDQDCILFDLSANNNGYIIEKGSNFQVVNDSLIYFSEDIQYSLNLKTKESKSELLTFLHFYPKQINSDFYFSFNKTLFKTDFNNEKLQIDFYLDQEIILESFDINAKSTDIVDILVESDNIWVKVFSDKLDGLTNIPVGYKTRKVRIELSNKNDFQLTEIKNLMIPGSINFGQIKDSIKITDSDGQAYFDYIVRSFDYSENFLAVIDETNS